jgi:hypothetical protein
VTQITAEFVKKSAHRFSGRCLERVGNLSEPIAMKAITVFRAFICSADWDNSIAEITDLGGKSRRGWRFFNVA